MTSRKGNTSPSETLDNLRAELGAAQSRVAELEARRKEAREFAEFRARAEELAEAQTRVAWCERNIAVAEDALAQATIASKRARLTELAPFNSDDAIDPSIRPLAEVVATAMREAMAGLNAIFDAVDDAAAKVREARGLANELGDLHDDARIDYAYRAHERYVRRAQALVQTCILLRCTEGASFQSTWRRTEGIDSWLRFVSPRDATAPLAPLLQDRRSVERFPEREQLEAAFLGTHAARAKELFRTTTSDEEEDPSESDVAEQARAQRAVAACARES
jgi:hypothetical protein